MPIGKRWSRIQAVATAGHDNAKDGNSAALALTPGDLFESRVNGEAPFAADPHHLVRSARRPADAQDSVAALDEAHGDRVEDLVERRVAYRPGTGEMHERQREPFADHRDMTGAKE